MRKDLVVWVGCVLLFGAGVVWGKLSFKTGFYEVANIHDLFEIFGAVATIVAASVAVIALVSWKSQFRHAERYKSVKALFEAASDLYKLRTYLMKLQEKYLCLMENGGTINLMVEPEETAQKEAWFAIQDRYAKAWAAAVIFLTDNECSSVPLSGETLRKLSFDLPMTLIVEFANSPFSESRSEFVSKVREITDDYRDQVALSISAIEKIFHATK